MNHIVTLSNRSIYTFAGKARCNCDPVPAHRTGYISHPVTGAPVRFMVGRSTGLTSRAVDFEVALAPGEELALDISHAQLSPIERAPIPADPIAWFGAPAPTLGGAPFAWIRTEPDGFGWSMEYHARLGVAFIVKLRLHWNADEPRMLGEISWFDSYTGTQLMVEAFPANFGLAWGDAEVYFPGQTAPDGEVPDPEISLAPPGDWCADGQGRALPVLFYWPRNESSDSVTGEGSAAALRERLIGAIGVQELLPGLGNPHMPTDLDPQLWMQARSYESTRRAHTWEQGVVGPNKRTSDTGAQEDQVWRRGECMLPGGAGAERIAYFGALKTANYPCHFHEQNGDPVDTAKHPDLGYWDGRPYLHTPDWLGKTRGLGLEEARGWHGPDVEHNLMQNLAAACRLVDSPACRELLEHRAQIYLGMYRVDKDRVPYLSLPYAARATLYEGLCVYHCWHLLTNRSLAQRVLNRASDRVALVYAPSYEGIPGDVWDWRRDDRIGTGRRWVPWQQAAGSYGLDVMSELIGSPSGRKIALRAALAVLRDAYWKQDGYWTARDVIAEDGSPVPSGAYDWFGCPLAVATVLRNDPCHEKANSIWAQYAKLAISEKDFAWLAPEIPLQRSKREKCHFTRTSAS